MNNNEVNIEESSTRLLVEKEKIAENEHNLSFDRYMIGETTGSIEFELVELGNICKLYQPKTITGNDLDENGEFFVYGANGIIGKYDKYNHEESEIAITCRGATCGKLNLTKPKSRITGNAMVVKPIKNNVDKKYLYYILKNSDLSSTITGAAQPQITRTNLTTFKIPLPSLEEQKKIVEELDGYQKIIDGCVLIIKSYKPIIKVNPCWNKSTLSEICDVRDGTHDSPKPVLEGGYPLITGKNLIDGKLDFDNVNYISDEDYKKINIRSNVDDGDILFGMIGTIGNPVLVNKDRDFAIKNVALLKIGENNKCVMSKFLVLILEILMDDFNKQSVGGSQKFVSLNFIRNYKIPLPTLQEQQIIVDEIEKEEVLIENTKQLKRVYKKKIEDKINEIRGK